MGSAINTQIRIEVHVRIMVEKMKTDNEKFLLLLEMVIATTTIELYNSLNPIPISYSLAEGTTCCVFCECLE
jgi:hypothetical protein